MDIKPVKLLFIYLLLGWLPGTLLGQVSYVASEIESDRPFGRLISEDLNGDGRLDLVDYRWRRGIGRELLIYSQAADGRYAPNPTLVEIKSEIIAVGFADLRPDPGRELVLLANNGVFSLSTAIDGYAGNLAPLARWQLVADIPEPDEVQFLRDFSDINGDGLVDLLLPGQSGYGLFTATGPEQFELISEFSTLNRDLDPALRPSGDAELSAAIDINSRDGIRLQVSARQPTPFAGFVEDWEAQSDETDTLLEAENWMPPALLADFNGDGRQDIVFLNVGLDIRGQVNLMYQHSDGSFSSAPDWQGPIDTRGDVRLLELNGDGRMDLARLTGEGDEWDVAFFLNRDGQFDFDQPDQVMRFAGYDVNLDVLDLDLDGTPELTVSYYTIPVVEAIRNTSIVRSQLIYGRDPERLFSRRPQFRLDESFSASDVRGLTEQMSLQQDVDGDGRPDALYITTEGAVAARRINADLSIDETPFWEYVPSRTVTGFEVNDLNQDNVPDLILRHSSSYTVLVARP
ncbi:MAG: VCBS repeat-containing protein [Gammaproteobacteria bacterium]|nr:VCBS repeat-containing protein [Pseudomonadales bacterium]